ncbi:unnamed protein product [Rhizophagus irregularis]|nr:unnamed protein product [Rhizophagus irregularis]
MFLSFLSKRKYPPIRRINHITYDFSSSYNYVPRSQRSFSLYIEAVTSATTVCKDIVYPLPPDMDPVPDNIDIPNELRPYIPDGQIYMMDPLPYKKNRKFRPPTYTYYFRVNTSSPISTHPTLDSSSLSDFTSHNDNNLQQHNDLLNLQQHIIENNKRQWDVVNTQLDNIII